MADLAHNSLSEKHSRAATSKRELTNRQILAGFKKKAIEKARESMLGFMLYTQTGT